MARIPRFVLYTEDTYPIFKFTIKKSDGSGPQDLSGVSVKCIFRLQGSSTNYFTGVSTNGTVTNATGGLLQYELPAPITDPGSYTGQVLIDFGASNVQRTERFEIKVLEGLASA